jgi:hypothetical protein
MAIGIEPAPSLGSGIHSLELMALSSLQCKIPHDMSEPLWPPCEEGRVPAAQVVRTDSTRRENGRHLLKNVADHVF